MPDFTTEPCQFRGTDSYADFQRLRICQLRFAQLDDGTTCIEPDHTLGMGQLLVPKKRFAEWWVTGRE